MNANVTIIIPLYGRPAHSLRIMYYLNKIRFPYPIILADGLVGTSPKSALETKTLFPNLNYLYITYPDDDGRQRFFTKMADAISRVQTPYVMLTDNDDFPIVNGIAASAKFLDQNTDYICCSGSVGGFTLQPTSQDKRLRDIAGSIRKLDFQYTKHYRSQDLNATDPWERVQAGFTQQLMTYYHVFRSSAAKKIHAELQDINPSDLVLHETYLYLRSFTLGKVRMDGAYVSYVRQNGTSTQYQARTNWAAHLLQGSYPEDFRKIIRRISEHLRETNCDRDAIERKLTKTHAERLRRDLEVHFYTEHPRIRQIKGFVEPASMMAKGFSAAWSKWFHTKIFRNELRRFSHRMRHEGASANSIELACSEISTIQETLISNSLNKFLLAHCESAMGQ